MNYTLKEISEASGVHYKVIYHTLKAGGIKPVNDGARRNIPRLYRFEDLPEQYKLAIGGSPLFSGGPKNEGMEESETRPPEGSAPEFMDEQFDDEIPTFDPPEGEGNPPLGPLENVTADFIRELKYLFFDNEVRNILMNNYQINPN